MPDKTRPDVMPDFITAGEYGPAFNAQNRMLDTCLKEYNLEQPNWRPEQRWYKSNGRGRMAHQIQM